MSGPAGSLDSVEPSVARSSLSLLAANVGGGILAFVFVVAVARLVGPEARGIVAFVTTVPHVVALASLLGLDVAFLYFAGSRPDLRRSIVASAIMCGVVMGVVGGVFGWLILSLFPGLIPSGIGQPIIILGLATSPLLSIQRLLNSSMIGAKRIRLANTVVVAIPAASLVAFLILGSVSSVSASSAIIAWAIGRLIGAMIAIWLAIRHIGVSWRGGVAEATTRSLRFGIRAYPSSIATLPIRRFDTLVLAASVPTAQLGLYTAGVNVAEIAMYLPNSVANVLLPESASREPEQAAVLVRRASIVVLTIMVIGGGIGILAAPILVRTIFGSDFAGSVLPLQLMLVAMIGSSVRRIYGAGLMARNRATTVSVLTVSTMSMIVALDLVLIPQLGAVGAATASAIAYCVGGSAVFAVYRRSLSRDVVMTLPSVGAVWRESLSRVRMLVMRKARLGHRNR